MLESKNTIPEYAIETRDIRIDYDDITAVHDMCLKIPPGEIFGLVGPNGAGKTSIIRVIATLLEPTYGDVLLNGIDALEQPDKVHSFIGYMPDLAPVPSDLKVFEFLELFATSHGLHGKSMRDRVEQCLTKVDMHSKREVFCNTLSRGMSQRVILAKTLLHQPKILFLDEPASGMDPIARMDLRQTLQNLRKEGVTVLISSHILTELSDMCTSVGFMNTGHLIASGPVDKVVDQVSPKSRKMVIELTDPDKIKDLEVYLEAIHNVEETAIDGSKIISNFQGESEDEALLLKNLVEQDYPIRSFFTKRAGIEDIMQQLNTRNGNYEKHSK